MKKSKLYKIVKDSVKEVLQEQNTVKDTRKERRTSNKDKTTGTGSSFMHNLIQKTSEKDQHKWVKYIQTFDDTLLSNWTPGNVDELILAWDEIMIDFDDGDDSQGAPPPSGWLDYWSVGSNGVCTHVKISDGWICSTNAPLTTTVYEDNNGTITDIGLTGTLCAPGASNTQAAFMTWATTAMGGVLADMISNVASIPGNPDASGYSDNCPACIPANVNAATTGPNLINASTTITGDNYPNPAIPAGSGLNIIDNKSCNFGDFCTRQYMDNNFCRPVADGGWQDICSGNGANTSIFASIISDNSTCTWLGCIDVPIDPNYVCSLYSGALCNQSGPQGEEQGPGTFTNSGCTAVTGCTNGSFLPSIGGNYDAANNVDDGSCTLDQYCNDGTSPNDVCSLNNGAFCTNGVLNTTYVDNINVTQNITWGTANNNNCGTWGCNDDGTDPNYPGRPAGAPTSGYTNCLPDAAGTAGPCANNYTPGTTDDGSCDYDVDNDGVYDWNEVGGCTDSNALNYDPLATNDDGSCIQPVSGCIDDGDIANNPLVQAWFDTSNLNDQDYWEGTLDINNTNYTNQTSPNTSGAQVTNPATYPGVASPDFSNTANVDDGSCTYPHGCTDSTMDNHDPNAIIDDGSCFKQGCMETSANNFDSTATVDDGTNCTFTGCTEPAAAAYGIFDSDGQGVQTVLDLPGSPYNGRVLSTTLGDTLDNSCEFEGCLDNSYPNYICTQAVNSGNGHLCTWVGPNGTPDTATYGQNAFIDDGSCTNSTIPGCMDSTAGIPGHPYHCNPDINGNGCWLAINYDPSANQADDCHYHFCNDDEAYNYCVGCMWTDQSVPTDDLCEYEGCTDANAPYHQTVSTEVLIGSGIYYYHADNDGCQMVPGTNTPGNGLFLTGDLSFSNYDCCPKPGCIDDGNITDPNFWTANNVFTGTNYATLTGIPTYSGPYPNTVGNFDPMATMDDGSCTYILGCTDPGAPNYNPAAHIDDGSCDNPLKCKRVKAVQCNPALTHGQDEHILVVNCMEISSNSPQVGDHFWHPNGVENKAPSTPTQGPPCPPGWDGVTHDPSYPPFGYVGQFDGYIGTWNCCQYSWNAGASAWETYPPNMLQFQCDEGHDRGPRRVNAVFEVVEIFEPIGTTIVNRPEWNCSTKPPSKPPILHDEPVPDMPSYTHLAEIKTSKSLRKALKSLYTPRKRKK